MLIELIKLIGSSVLAFILPSLSYVFCVSLAWSIYNGANKGSLASWLFAQCNLLVKLYIHLIGFLYIITDVASCSSSSFIVTICFAIGPYVWYFLARKCFPLTVKYGI